MFELSIALKYLIPRKRHLSVTLIAMMSVGVISLVVWLLLVFLSVTEGIEKTWLKKLTDLNAPIRITPTPEYFSSYYYKVDSISHSSNFSVKTIEEKSLSPLSDPYDPEEDQEIPYYWPAPDLDEHGHLIDPVKELDLLLSQLKKEKKTLVFQDYEMSGATLKLQLLRNKSNSLFTPGQESLNFLTQVSYLSTPPEHPNILSSLLISPTAKDINHLFFLAGYRMENTLSNGEPELKLAQESFQTKISDLLSSVSIQTIQTVPPEFRFQIKNLSDGLFTVYGVFKNDTLIKILLPKETSSQIAVDTARGEELRKGSLEITASKAVAKFLESTFCLHENTSLELHGSQTFSVTINTDSVKNATQLEDITLKIQGAIQNHPLKGSIPWKNFLIKSFSLKDSPKAPWAQKDSPEKMRLPVNSAQENGILLPKTFQENGVLLGDKGFLSYTSSTASALQEQRTPIFVAGFYDPGVISIGSKCLLVPREITKTINSANTAFTYDKIALNGLQVWFDSPSQAWEVKTQIEALLKEKNIEKYWKVVSFQEYDFAKDLLEQFQSDKYLFSLIAIIILIVACCNILSFLIIQVNDKKKEIAILQAMGASKKTIAMIFGLLGIFVGVLGCIIGSLGALFTLHHIDALVQVLSALQGHDAFNQVFYGSSLPNTLSTRALLFILFTTPILSLLAGLIPALKACRLHPSSILRSES